MPIMLAFNILGALMKVAQSIEVAVILIVGGAVWSVASHLPRHILIGNLLLYSSALLLFQSLLRDIWLITKSRRNRGDNSPKVARCMCVESLVGLTGVLVGLLLFGLRLHREVSVEPWEWGAFVTAVLAIGFLIKDFVLEAKPWRIRRDKNHLNIIVRWKV